MASASPQFVPISTRSCINNPASPRRSSGCHSAGVQRKWRRVFVCLVCTARVSALVYSVLCILNLKRHLWILFNGCKKVEDYGTDLKGSFG